MRRIKRFTRQLLYRWYPCPEYPLERIEELAAGRTSISVREVFDLPIPAVDRLWLLCHEGILPEETFRKLARRFALEVIPLWDAPPIVREYLETGDGSLRSAACILAKRTAVASFDSVEKSAAIAAWGASRGTKPDLDRFRSAADSAWAVSDAANRASLMSTARSATTSSFSISDLQLEQLRSELEAA